MYFAPDKRQVVAEKPSPFCVVLKSETIEKQEAYKAEWLLNVLRFEAFWNEPAWLRYWCGKCGERHIHEVIEDGPIATCPNCSNRVDLRPDGKFGGMDIGLGQREDGGKDT